MAQAQEAEWDFSEDAPIWRQFLESRTGRRLFPKALEGQPGLLAGGNTNDILIRSGECRGWIGAFQILHSLAYGEPKLPEPEGSSAYPPLDKDDAWDDGKKLSP